MTSADTSAEQLRQGFASAWGRMGAAWGVAPSTAAVQGYLLVRGEAQTESELQRALRLSHRATRVALAECETWGIVERASELRRSGQRGPAGVAWVAVDDPWEWFGRVIRARKEREGDPVVAVLKEYRAAAEANGADPEVGRIRDRLASLLTFVGEFDHALGAIVRARTESLEHLFEALGRVDAKALDRLLAVAADVPAGDLAAAATTLSGLSPRALRNLIRLAGRPQVGRLLSTVAGRALRS